ncbi:hypothetical protein CONPUDRAFT_21500, partial [Coniophora puteana RWD-64-598 SS2]
WTPALQQEFERRILRLTVSAGLPFSWADNPEWQAFCHKFIPAAKLPSQRTLSRRLLPEAVAEGRASIRAAAQGHEATLQADGWTGLNSHHLIAFMITVNNQVHTVQVDDVSAERKTADNLLDRLQAVIDKVNTEWKAPIIAVVTDASGESRKARRLLGERHPELMVLDCYAHQ